MAETLKEALLDLYLDVKVRSNLEVTSISLFDLFVQLNELSDDKLKQERVKLRETLSPELLIDYIRQSIEILLLLHTNRDSLDAASSDMKVVDINIRQLFKGQKIVKDLVPNSRGESMIVDDNSN